MWVTSEDLEGGSSSAFPWKLDVHDATCDPLQHSTRQIHSTHLLHTCNLVITQQMANSLNTPDQTLISDQTDTNWTTCAKWHATNWLTGIYNSDHDHDIKGTHLVQTPPTGVQGNPRPGTMLSERDVHSSFHCSQPFCSPFCCSWWFGRTHNKATTRQPGILCGQSGRLG